MTNKNYSTRTEAIEMEIIPALGDFANDFDIEAIADEVLDSDRDGYWMNCDIHEFYEIAAKYDKNA